MRYPRVIEIRSRGHLLFLIAAIHVIAAISFAHLVPASTMIAGLFITALSLVLCVRKHHRGRGMQLFLEDSGELRLSDGGAHDFLCPLGSCVDLGWAVWLRWVPTSDPHQRRSGLVLLRPEFEPADWRALRIWLRHKAPEVARVPLNGA